MIIPAKKQTSAAVAQHYDDLDPFYRELWGDHVHHGLWTTGLEKPAQAVENLIACVARRLELDPGQHVCDVGCGYGATVQWLAEHHGVHVTGLTISAVQAQRASERSTGSSQLRFLWRDWLDNGFETGSFDHIVAIESSDSISSTRPIGRSGPADAWRSAPGSPGVIRVPGKFGTSWSRSVARDACRAWGTRSNIASSPSGPASRSRHSRI